MKTLMLLRHAKSSWDDRALQDFERPLNDRGRRDAPRMGKALKDQGAIPDLIVASPAVRARETVEAFTEAAGIDLKLNFDGSIYGATSAELMKLVRLLPDSSSIVLLVGHNPGFEDLSARLTGVSQHMPTAALVRIDFSSDRWEDVEDGKGKLVWMLTPKQLG